MTEQDIQKALDLAQTIIDTQPACVGRKKAVSLASAYAELAREVAELKATLAERVDSVNDLWKQIAELRADKERMRDAAEKLIYALEVCHICTGVLSLEDAEPAHCENCSYDCDEHEAPSCTPLYDYVRNLKWAIRAKESR